VAGKNGKEEFGGDGGAATQAALRVNGLACDAAGNIYVSGANRIRRISRDSGIIRTIAGTGKIGFFGDGGPALAADLANPSALAVDRNGTIYFSDEANNRIRAIDGKGRIRTVAGNGRSGPPDDGDAIRNPAGEVRAVAVDGDGDVVFMNDARRIRRLRVSQSRMETLLENPRGDLENPREVAGLAVSPDGTIFFDLPRSNRVSSIPAALLGKKAQ
jgi:serine/threonine-protein kinase